MNFIKKKKKFTEDKMCEIQRNIFQLYIITYVSHIHIRKTKPDAMLMTTTHGA